MNEEQKVVTEEEAKQPADTKKKKTLLAEIWEWVYTIVIAVAIAFLIKGFLFDIVKVDGKSMFPTLEHNDRLIITKLGYEPDNGDIVILDSAYKNRTAHYDNMAEAKGKEHLNLFEKFVNYFTLPESLKHRYYVKRVIATPGQTIDIKDGKVYVDGKELDEEYYDGETIAYDTSVDYPVTVEEDCVFVMGDNRNHSKDSRDSSLGQVPFEAVIGKSQLRVFPLNQIGLTK